MSNYIVDSRDQESTQHPSESRKGATAPQPQRHEKQQPNEGDYRNIETAVNSPSQFNDDYAAKQDAAIAQKEADTEDENKS